MMALVVRGSLAASARAILDGAERAGANALVLSPTVFGALEAQFFDEWKRRCDAFPLLAIETFGAASLAAPDRDEADAALAVATARVRQAGELRARFGVVQLGEVRAVAGEWTRARDRFLRGRLDAEDARAFAETRDRNAARALDAARRALDRLAREAERAGVTVLVKNGRRYVDVPTPRELDLLLDDLRGAPLAPLLDVAAAHLTDVMGFCPLALTLASFAPGPLCYFGDACGPVGALAPGRGIVDLAAVRAALPSEAALAFNPWAGLGLEEVVDAMNAFTGP